MANQRLLAVVTALLLTAGAQDARAAYTLDQLEQIEQFILGEQWSELGAFINENRELLDGDDVLAQSLRAFVDDAADGVINQLSSLPSRDTISEARQATY